MALRLLLDAHVSARRIGVPLEKDGHDVLAIAGDSELKEFDDLSLLLLAAEEQRIVVTFNTRDFNRYTHELTANGTDNAGCIMIVKLRHNEFGAVLRRLRKLLKTYPDQTDWTNRIVFLSPSSRG